MLYVHIIMHSWEAKRGIIAPPPFIGKTLK